MRRRVIPPVGPDDHTLGAPNAPITLVEYGDFECPQCADAFPIIERIRARLGDRLRFVFRHYPLSETHPHAQHAAEISEAAAAHGRFWQMHRVLFEHHDALDDSNLVAYAAMVGLDTGWAANALAAGAFADRVNAQASAGGRAGVSGTPTLFINGTRYDLTLNERVLLATLARAGT
jgi:protein-disulfide isomerase